MRSSAVKGGAPVTGPGLRGSFPLLVLLGLLLTSGAEAQGAVPVLPVSDAGAPSDAEEEGTATPDAAAAQPSDTFLDEVTVTATRSAQTVKETPGQVDVVTHEEISELGYSGPQDLVRYVPGVYVDGDSTRLGTSGFNIRGIGGNRVLTRIDGIPTAEQFDFGPFSVTQYALDVDALERAEIVRSAGSALYGSDALGGVVSLTTRSPRSYLAGQPMALSLRGAYDGRNDEASETLVFARGGDRWQASVLYGHRDGGELDNQGEVESSDFTRTAPNPIDRRQDNVLAKLAYVNGSSEVEGALEWFDSRADTEVFSAVQPGSPFSSAVLESVAQDTQERRRLSLRQSLVKESVFTDSFLWRAYWQDADTAQEVDELRQDSQGLLERNGLLTFEQESYGAEVEVHKALGSSGRQSLVYGLVLQRDSFDQLRDREELYVEDGSPVPTSLAFPSKYFPASDVDELGAFAQAELAFFSGRLKALPGLRFDRYDLDADQEDTVYLDGNPGTPPPVDITDQAISPKLALTYSMTSELSAFAQYAQGFRAPPMSAVNNGFTNQAGGYRTLPNPNLEPETSDNFELGLRGSFSRGSFSVTAFDNDYEDFIETVTLGFDPQTFLIEFQPQNLAAVSIRGIELAGELRIGRSWRLRGAYSNIEGEDETADEPLESIAPPTLVAGLRYQAPGGRWGAEATSRFTESKDAGDLPEGSDQFQAPSYSVFDLAAWIAFNEHLSLQVTAWNLGDESYWLWPYARGQAQGSATIDRYTSPGRSFSAQARLRF